MDLSKYRQLFLDECREHLQVMNRELLRLEQEGETGGVDALFRAAHSIKGMSGLDGVRRRRRGQPRPRGHPRPPAQEDARRWTPALMALLYEGVDTLGALVAEIEEKGATQLEVAGIVARLRGASPARRRPADAGARRSSLGAARAAVASSLPRRRLQRPASPSVPDVPAAPEAPDVPEAPGAAAEVRRSAEPPFESPEVPEPLPEPSLPEPPRRRRSRGAPRGARRRGRGPPLPGEDPAPTWSRPGAASSRSSRRSSRWCAISCAAASSRTPASCASRRTRRRSCARNFI